MKAHNRAKVTFYKWTIVMFIPVIVLLLVMLATRNFKKTYHIAESACDLINQMFEHRAYRTRVAHRGYELFIQL